MVEDSGLTGDETHRFTTPDRIVQLEEFKCACERLALLFQENDEYWRSRRAAGFANEASLLLDQGFDQAKLSDLGVRFPGYLVSWLNPKSAEFDAPRGAWQDEVAVLTQRARDLSVDFRTLAIYGDG
jgi:hypothetical protein